MNVELDRIVLVSVILWQVGRNVLVWLDLNIDGPLFGDSRGVFVESGSVR